MSIDIERLEHCYRGCFSAMAGPCEVLVDTADERLVFTLAEMAAAEAWRIEAKFSRYRDDNIIHQINHARGQPVEVDAETARLLDFAARCYDISEGLFDITSGILRLAWAFDGGDRVPTQSLIDSLLERIGWFRLEWENPWLTMPEGMQLDFGGIGKEYAVDRVADLLAAQTDAPLLINFGGDLHCSGAQRGGQPWTTGIEDPENQGKARETIRLYSGALATSGDARRYVQKDGIRYSHILNPKTGWPDPRSPRSVTVAAQNCTDAGILATLAMLQGKDAEEFLQAQQVRYWVYR
jgi:thiamine biosynthesis lipoprotein